MKTIAFMDIAGGYLMAYNPKDVKKNTRINQAFNELQRMTEIKLYLVKGKKIRHISTRRF